MPSERGSFERGGLKIPLPTWSVRLLAGLLVVGAGALLYQQLLRPMIYPDSALVPVEDLMQMRESMKHFGETPSKSILLDGATVSSWEDECVSVAREWGDSRIVTFDLHPSRTFSGVERSALHRRVRILRASVLALGGGGDCEGECADWSRHGRWREWYERVNNCVLLVYREWPDGCLHRQPFDECSGTWGPIEPLTSSVAWLSSHALSPATRDSRTSRNRLVVAIRGCTSP